MNKTIDKTELGVIRALANTEEYTRKAEKELISNMFMPLNEEENKKVFLDSGKRIVTAKEDIQAIKEKKTKELIDKYKQNEQCSFSDKEYTKTYIELYLKSKVVRNWFEVIRTSEKTCKIIDRYTKVDLLETDIQIADMIIKDTF